MPTTRPLKKCAIYVGCLSLATISTGEFAHFRGFSPTIFSNCRPTPRGLRNSQESASLGLQSAIRSAASLRCPRLKVGCVKRRIRSRPGCRSGRWTKPIVSLNTILRRAKDGLGLLPRAGYLSWQHHRPIPKPDESIWHLILPSNGFPTKLGREASQAPLATG